MTGGKCADQTVQKMKQAIASFGFTVVVRGPRVFVLWPGTEEILICKRLDRVPYWELNRVDRNLWELYGAVGIPIFEFIVAPELIKWMYEKALTTPAIIEGLAQTAKESGIMPIVEKIHGRFRERNFEAERLRAKKKKRDKALQEAEQREHRRQEKRDRISQTGQKASRRQS